MMMFSQPVISVHADTEVENRCDTTAYGAAPRRLIDARQQAQ